MAGTLHDSGGGGGEGGGSCCGEVGAYGQKQVHSHRAHLIGVSPNTQLTSFISAPALNTAPCHDSTNMLRCRAQVEGNGGDTWQRNRKI
jgi:hypothetical protein